MDKFTYHYLGLEMFSYVETYNFNNPKILFLNEDLGKKLGFETNELENKDFLQYLLGKSNNELYPISLAYAGHQFGNFSILGDGRACIIDEIEVGNKLFDIHLKGSGPTPYSRRGDGFSTLESSLREYIMTLSLDALGVSSTKTLAVISTGNELYRNNVEQGGISVRVACSHIRIGTLEYAFYKHGKEKLKEVVDYTINRHYSEISEKENKYEEFYKRFLEGYAKLIADWMSLGFIHGVMNTDNVLLSNETIDLGPCAFLDTYNPSQVFSFIDRQGRYSYENQPQMALFNLARLGDVIVNLLELDEEEAVMRLNKHLKVFSSKYEEYYYSNMCRKLGLIYNEESIFLVNDLLNIMYENKLDYTKTFVELTYGKLLDSSLENWYSKYSLIDIDIEKMKSINPVVIPRNNMIQDAIDSYLKGDSSLYTELLSILSDPYNEKHIESIIYNVSCSNKSFTSYCGT